MEAASARLMMVLPWAFNAAIAIAITPIIQYCLEGCRKPCPEDEVISPKTLANLQEATEPFEVLSCQLLTSSRSLISFIANLWGLIF